MNEQLRNDLGQPITRLVDVLSGQSDCERMLAIAYIVQKLGDGLMGMDSRPDPDSRHVAKACLATAFRRAASYFDC